MADEQKKPMTDAERAADAEKKQKALLAKKSEPVVDPLVQKIKESKLVENGKLAKVYHHPVFGYFKVLK